MTQEQFAVRKQRAEQDVFVITAAEEGWRVRSARNPSRFYLVSGDGADVRCNCPDFQTHAAEDPTWRCKHVLTVLNHRARARATDAWLTPKHPRLSGIALRKVLSSSSHEGQER